MDRKKKIGLAALIIGVGVGIALQFRKTELTFGHSDSPVAAGAAADGQAMTAAPAIGVFPKPSSTFDGRIEPPPSDSSVSGTPREKTSLGALQSVANTAGDENEHPLVDLNEPDKIHKIIDGDTLAKLAQRYWGRADRYVDLYSYNRDVLSDPDVLPIGAELRIPAHLVVSIEPEHATTAPVLPLAPLPKVAAPGAPAMPAAAAQPPSQRTYKVQAGDNLVDIARKLYGDGRRHTDLFEANRRVMRTPTDLKPGMLLVVP